MKLNFILSLGFKQIDFKDINITKIEILYRGIDFNVVKNECISGIFQHKKEKKLLMVISSYDKNPGIFIGILEEKGFSKHIELTETSIDHDKEMEKKIVKLVVEEYTQQQKLKN